MKPPAQPAAGADDEAEGGRGLFIVREVARQVGHFYPKGGGKVVWAELAFGCTLAISPQYDRWRVTSSLSRVVWPTSSGSHAAAVDGETRMGRESSRPEPEPGAR